MQEKWVKTFHTGFRDALPELKILVFVPHGMSTRSWYTESESWQLDLTEDSRANPRPVTEIEEDSNELMRIATKHMVSGGLVSWWTQFKSNQQVCRVTSSNYLSCVGPRMGTQNVLETNYQMYCMKGIIDLRRNWKNKCIAVEAMI